MIRLAILVGLVTACKVDAQPPARTGSQLAGSDRDPGASSDVPIAQLVPDITGAKLLQTRARDDAQTYVRWCIDEADAAKRVIDSLAREGWAELATRGTGERIGVAASKAGIRFSATIGGSDDACAGTLVTATLARIGAPMIPSMPPGERIR